MLQLTLISLKISRKSILKSSKLFRLIRYLIGRINELEGELEKCNDLNNYFKDKIVYYEEILKEDESNESKEKPARANQYEESQKEIEKLRKENKELLTKSKKKQTPIELVVASSSQHHYHPSKPQIHNLKLDKLNEIHMKDVNYNHFR